MSTADPRRVVVDTPARLHLGFIDLHGGLGRLFGSIGVAIARPRYVVEACRLSPERARDETPADLSRVMRALDAHMDVPARVGVRVLEDIPRHQGLGSGTQRALALACAISRLAGRSPSAAQLAAMLGRGRRSGVGVAVFAGGGLVVDAGVAREAPSRPAVPSRASEAIPPVIFQRALPPDWEFVLATPPGEEGLHGAGEETAFDRLQAASEAVASRVSRLVLMKALPAALADDIEQFGAAITDIQSHMGAQFAAHQGGLYTSDCGRAIAEFALARGAAGVGQSSWGPTVFALVRGGNAADALAAAIRNFVGDARLHVWHAPASPRGATVLVEP
jgi:beta-RFAP synthase